MTTAEGYGTASTTLTTLYGQEMFESGAGDLCTASEKSWDASAQVLNSFAERIGWRHGSHDGFYRIIRRLRNEMDVPELRQQFAFARELHANFYENWLDESEIRESAVHVRDFVERLARL